MSIFESAGAFSCNDEIAQPFNKEKSFMKISNLLPLFVLCFLLAWSKAQPPANTPPQLSVAQWEEDINYFAKQLVKKHKNAFHSVTEEQFNRAIGDLKKDLPHLAYYQVLIRLLQITASVGDGHTYVHLPADMKRYPVTLYWFGKELYAIRATENYRQALGKKVIKINGLPLADVMQKISTILSRNQNDSYIMFNSAINMTVPQILHALEIVTDVEKARFTFADESGNETEVELPAIVQTEQKWIGAAKEEPLFRQRMNEKFWFSYLEDIDAIYVNFKSYDDLAKISRKLFDFIDKKKPTSMILDLRQNGGGDFYKGRRLLSKIKKNSTLNQKDHLFVIPGRRTFSAAMVNTIDFKKETNATVIGEPPGARPNEYSENDEMKLPNSGIVISYSTKYYKFLDENVPAIEPDVRVDPNWKDYVNGIDPVMEKIRQIILRSKVQK
jgi:hypothetical protein